MMKKRDRVVVFVGFFILKCFFLFKNIYVIFYWLYLSCVSIIVVNV